jgi:elongation factor G
MQTGDFYFGTFGENSSGTHNALLEQLIEDKVPATDSVFALVSQIHQDNAFIPAYMGAAEHGNGVFRLMKSLRHECTRPGDIAARLGIEARAIAVYADNRKHVGKSVLLRDLDGGLAQGDMLGGEAISTLNGLDGKPAKALDPGALAIAVKSDHLLPGKGYTSEEPWSLPEWSMGLPPRLPPPDHPRG